MKTFKFSLGLIFPILISISTQAFSITSSDTLETVLRLKAGQVVPKSLIEEADSRELARALVKRKSLKEDASNARRSEHRFDFYQHSQIVLAFPFQYFASIRQHGFLNQFQVNHSINLDRKHRAIVEDKMLDLRIPRDARLSSRVNVLRPKYAYLNLDLDRDDPFLEKLSAFPALRIEGRYGNVFASLRSNVKDRATFTAGDSMLVLGAKIGTASTLNVRQTNPEKADHYFEAQIWGELNLSDVEFFLVNCEGPDFGDALKTENIEALKESGLPVYKCVPRSKYPNSSAFPYFLDRRERL